MLPAAGDPYFKLKAAGYVDAGKKLGYDVKIYDAGGYGNLQKQVTQIEDVIQRKVSGIVLVPASSDGTVPCRRKGGGELEYRSSMTASPHEATRLRASSASLLT